MIWSMISKFYVHVYHMCKTMCVDSCDNHVFDDAITYKISYKTGSVVSQSFNQKLTM